MVHFTWFLLRKIFDFTIAHGLYELLETTRPTPWDYLVL